MPRGGGPLNAAEEDIVAKVSEHGWFCMCVGDNERSPAFAYTVGFWETLKTPELIMFGLWPKQMHTILWSAFRLLKDEKVTMRDGARWNGLLEGYECITRPVHRSQIIQANFNSALWYRGHRTGREEDLQAFQLFWPGERDRLFPWDKDCAEGVRDLQPLLYLPREKGLA